MKICNLPFKESLLNSKQTLIDVDAIDEAGVIINEPLFDEWVDQMSTKASQVYELDNEKLWFKNPIVNEPIVPNEEQFNKIDEKRKLMGLYEDQISGSLPIHFMTEEENGYPILTALWKIKERNLVYPELVDKINDLLKVEEFSVPIYLANDDVFDSPLDYANYDPVNNVINIRRDGFFPEKYSDQTILHEIIHAMTYNKVLNNPSHRARLELLLEVARQEIEKKYGKVNYSGKWYGLKNEHEFLAEGFSNPEFIKELMSIRHWSQSLFDDFLDWIFNTLGLKKEPTIYNELYDLFVEITNLTSHPNKVLSDEGKFPNMEIVFRQGEEQIIPPDEQNILIGFIKKENVKSSDNKSIKQILEQSPTVVQGEFNNRDFNNFGFVKSQEFKFHKEEFSDPNNSKLLQQSIREVFTTGTSSLERNNRLLLGLLQELTSNKFNGKLFKFIQQKFNNVEIRLIEGDTTSLFIYDNSLHINLDKLRQKIEEDNIENIDDYYSMIISEELFHLVVDNNINEDQYRGIIKEIEGVPGLLNRLTNLYGFDQPLNGKQVVDEYIRMLIQDHFFNTTSELKRVETIPSALNWIKDLWNFIKDFFKKEYHQYTKQVVDKSIEIINESQTQLFQLPSNLPTEVTPEVYNQLVSFAKKLNPDFKIEVLDDLLSRKGANGIAQIKNWTIQLQKGKESALGEEVSHFFFELLPVDHPLRKSMMSDITLTRMYKMLRTDPDYNRVYEGNTDLLKREAAAKLISLYLSDKELFNHYVGSGQLVDKIIRWIKDFFNWIRGKKTMIGSFVYSAESIMRLDTSQLAIERAAQIQDMYSLADIVKEATILKTVKDLDTKRYDKIYINLSDTIFDVSTYDFKGNKKGTFMDKAMQEERELFYKEVKLTNLGEELKDKIAAGFISPEKIIFFSSMYNEPGLITRLNEEFGNVQLIRTNVESTIEDDKGRVIKQTTLNTLKDVFSEVEGTFAVVDNQRLPKDVNVNFFFQYNNRQTVGYEPMVNRIRNREATEQNIKRIRNLVEELKGLGEESITSKIIGAFKIIRNEVNTIENLEEKLQGIDEDYESIFKNENGDLLLPLEKAKKMKQFVEELDKYEEGLIELVGTLEAVTMFFKDRNDTKFERIKEQIETGDEKAIDSAIRELNQITKMGKHWQDYIQNFREIIKDKKADLLHDLLGRLDNQITITQGLTRELSKQAIGNRLDKELELYNANANAELDEFKKKLSETENPQERERLEKRIEEVKKKVKTPEDIINILNGTHKDIDPLTVWIKTLHNSSDPLIGGISKLIQKHGYDVENKTISLAQELGDRVTKIMEKYGVTEQDIEDYLVTTGHTWEYEGEGEERKLVRKETWNLLFKYKDLDRRFEMMQPYLDAKRKWSKAVEEKKPKEEILELKKDFIKKKNDFEDWETTNWNREYTEDYYRRYDEFKQNEDDALLFEEIALIQTSIWNKIEDLTLQANFVSDSEGLKLINQQIEDARKELKRLKKEVNVDGTPKSEKEVRMAKMLKRKSEIDNEIYEFQSDQKKFKGDFLKFIAGVQMDSTIKANLVKLVEEDTYGNLYNYASKNAPYQVKQWLELNTVNRIDPLWYEERKVITEEISRITNEINRLKGLDQTEDFDKKWKEMFNLTSDLRDEDNIFDGSQADPNVQLLVKDIEEELERLKGIARESDSDSAEMDTLKKQLREWISKLNQIQSKKVTDAYIDEFIELATNTGFSEAFEMVNSHIVIDANTHPLDIINTLEFQKFIEDNPEHPFSIWYKNNHFLKTTYNAFGEQVQSETPTYIWYKIEPTDPKRIHTIPSMKYSKRVVRDGFKNDKKDPNKYHPVLKWLPKSPEFIDENWMNLQRRDTPKKDGLTQILKLLTDFHLRTQEETNVYEARLGLKLPYVRKQGVEGLKAKFVDLFDTRNKFEQGEANFDESVTDDKFKLKGWFNGFVDRLYGNTNDETTPSKFLRVAVPYSHYMDKEEVTKNPLLSIIMFNATTHRADRMLKTVPLFNLIEDALVNPPTVDLKGRIQNSNTNRISALRFAKEHHIYGMNKKYELGEETGKKVDTALRYIRNLNTLGSLGFPFGILNVLKNNLQGRLQNLIGGRFGNWSTPKSMRKAAANTKINFAYYISQAEKPLSERGLDFQILSYFNPTLDANIYENLIKGSQKRAIHNGHFFLFNNAMEFSIAANLLYSHLYHVKVKNEAGEIKELYEILEFRDGKVQPKQGFKELKSGKEINEQYLLDTKLAYKTVVEYVQGRISTKTLLSTTTIGQAVLYFKNWLIPMVRRRFDSKKENYMIGEDLEGYWRTWLRMSLLMTKDMWNDHKTYWNTYTEEEKRNFITAMQEIAFMAISLAILSLVFGFDADDPDKFKKLKDASYAEKLAVLLMVQAKSETEALSAMPFLNVEKSAVPTVLTEGVKWVTNPTIGLSIIDNTWKTLNALWALMLNQDSAYYNRDMPQYDIEKGDTKAWHYTKKILQFDDFLLQSNPEDKLRIVIGNMKR